MFETAPIGEISMYYVLIVAGILWLAHKIDGIKK